ncbi:MAG: polysaccharide pyruvyl transferase family protein [Candidatus Gastranaerophilales bacterium]|nr:polysaccharide pyruvyl transferase family protein [Candidatus Gastranaerophilales bacterium]
MGNITEINQLECSGCGACANICPKKAITMTENEEGFLYPVIDKEKCINCGLCISHCGLNIIRKKTTASPECYAVMASDEIRRLSSSGGMFTLAANYILNNGGYICGAAYDDDFSVEHIIVDNYNDLSKLRGSKYFQSNTNDCYSRVKKLLKEGKQVLFTGCPCQISGLYNYLGSDFENLITMELLCHGTPSYKVFRKYLDEHFNIDDIKRIDFRDKSVKWRSDYLTIEFKNGDILRENIDTNSYEKGFHSGLFNRKSCAPCRFARLPRQADITIADWWGILNVDKELDDNMGTSLVLINSKKGSDLFKDIRNNTLKTRQIPLKKAKNSVNKTIYKTLKHHSGREYFFKNLNNICFDKNVEMSLNSKYDTGIMGLWAGNNYGCILTGYALYKTVQNLGYSTAFIDRRRKNKPVDMTTMVRRFSKNVNIISVDNSETYKLNDYFETFLLGSDQLWRYDLTMLYDRFYMLDFALSNKRKISYATSFGNDFTSGGNEEEMHVLSYLLNKFDAISVRETYAVDILKHKTGISAAQVLDPVFVCGAGVYKELIDKSRIETGSGYIFAYILDPTDEKNSVLEHAARTLNKKLYVTTDAEDNSRKRKLITEGEVLGEIDVEDWLKYYQNSDYIITDSFHGSCFSIIFKKPFAALGNVERGIKRFYSLLDGFNLTSRLFTSLEDLKSKDLLHKNINYDRVYKIIDEQRKKSLDWLKQSLELPLKKGLNDYDIVRKLIAIYSKPERFYKYRYYFNRLMYKLTFGRCHKYFKSEMNYWHIRLREYRKYRGFLQM